MHAPVATRVIQLDPTRDPRWADFVSSRRDALIYHHPAWFRVLEQAYGGEPVVFACEEPDGTLSGILPLFHTRGLLTGHRLSSLPHTPIAGPLADGGHSTALLLDTAVKWARTSAGAQLQIKSDQPGLHSLAGDLACSLWEESYVLDLPAQSQDLHFGHARNHARIKWAVNKAAKSGVHVRCAEDERDLHEWYVLYLDTMRWHGVPPRPYRFFTVAWELLRPRGLMRLLLAEERAANRKLLAGSIFLAFGETCFYAFNGRRLDSLAMRPNDLIQWHAITGACSVGCRRYDFGEVADRNKGLADFKAKWGAEPHRYYRYHYPAPRALETATLRSDGLAHKYATGLWRHLPLKTTAALGNWLYTHI